MRANRRPSRARRGYAMVLVLAFLVLLLSLVGLASRQVGSMLRVETARLQRQQRDDGVRLAVAKALGLLETGSPPTDPYTCGVALGATTYAVTFASEGDAEHWVISVAPAQAGDATDPMPDRFGP